MGPAQAEALKKFQEQGVGKPLLVGEVNPYGADPEMALYPLPENAAGGRLARILGLSRTEYLRRFDRVNLCSGYWTIQEARCSARRIAVERWNRPPEDRGAVIALGKKVQRAFTELDGWQVPGVLPKLGRVLGNGIVWYFLPHPSGRNKIWNRPGMREKARELLKEFLPAPEREHDTSGERECWCGPERLPDGLVVHRRLQ